jgi:hypothetical protein
MTRERNRSIRAALLSGVVMAAWPTLAAEVTPQRLLNPEPQNWLMNHRTYDGQRFSPLARITKDNVKNLKLAYAVPLGGGAGDDAADMRVDTAGGGRIPPPPSRRFLGRRAHKIDGRSGDTGRHCSGAWTQEAGRQATNRGATFSRAISKSAFPTASSSCAFASLPPTRRPARSMWETNVVNGQNGVQPE